MRLDKSDSAGKIGPRREFIKFGSVTTLSALTCGLSTTLAQEIADPHPVYRIYDVIVLGLGAMGSSCLYHTAKRGAKVLGLEQFDIGHMLGSSGGFTRQTKVAPYIQGPDGALIRRANENWRMLEKDSGQKIFHQCGWLNLGVPRNRAIAQSKSEGTRIELLDPREIAERYPQFHKLSNKTEALLDHDGGLLRSELSIASHCYAALRMGAHVRAQEAVQGWEADETGVTVKTSRGSYRAKHIVMASGAWNAKLVPELNGKLEVTRLSLGWFASKDDETFEMKNFPTWGHGSHYGFPVLPDFPGIKVAKHWKGDPADPDNLDRTPNRRDESLVRNYLARHLPLANGATLAHKICMYTWSQSWLGPLPREKRVSVITACNGGGFKFSSAYGEALADFATEGKTELPVGHMRKN